MIRNFLFIGIESLPFQTESFDKTLLPWRVFRKKQPGGKTKQWSANFISCAMGMQLPCCDRCVCPQHFIKARWYADYSIRAVTRGFIAISWQYFKRLWLKKRKKALGLIYCVSKSFSIDFSCGLTKFIHPFKVRHIKLGDY